MTAPIFTGLSFAKKEEAQIMNLPTDCPKHIQCSAPICPLDQDWRKRSHLKGERVCFYLAEAVKDRAKANFEGARLGKLFEVIHRGIPDIISRHGPIKKALVRAANSGARMTRLASGARGVQ